ncbi:MAG: prephenate dehydrogenase/arogenate dehydrogenase family protein [Acidobacteria bacterium]|nr:prephenate dehydrogenase/arogenate dehydrogenase family protein [Acidobacteriota bacterium]
MPAAPFRRLAIVGVGLIGGSIGLAVRRRIPGARVVGIDRAPVLRRALAQGAIHEGSASIARGLARADLVVLALPVDGILKTLPAVARHADPGAIVTDVGGSKEAIVKAARRAGLGRRFVGGHPMAGSERSGVSHADGGLFARAPWLLCPAARGRGIDRVRALARRLGARPVVLSARRHDQVVARFSHLPQLISIALVNAAARGAGGRPGGLAGPAFRQMSRLAASPAGLWASILKTNGRAAGKALDEFAGEIRRLRRALGGDLKPLFRRAARARARLLGRDARRREG